ncbi:FH1/FH2 domain-containing protein 3 Formactin-2 Formin -like protein overexpressed in spleen 2 [Channa argus]|uniref:FH1/FH2 domain-containing protein 3 Formactin-2 Formin-like protein overexpressed in spleen 2 n=1 Tax=Channa argus TaxID=215402 RepID=A0A6G1PNK7_CHAAH|nr:FH1/FH2 domain-containing protein 3 Formactin-2 Formin -like protein overexpressed in spleen 2 [Channa argus]
METVLSRSMCFLPKYVSAGLCTALVILIPQISFQYFKCNMLSPVLSDMAFNCFLVKTMYVQKDDKDLVHEFVVAEGLTCLIKVGAEADQNYQNYILRALGQIMLYVDGMNGLISHNETVQWLYTLVGSKFRLVVKTALKLLLVFVEYTESNAVLLIKAVNVVDAKRGTKLWSNVMEILDEKDGVDTELLVYAMTLVNKATLRHEDGDDETQLPLSSRKDRRRASVGGTNERRGLERRRSRRHSLQNGRGHASAPASPNSAHTSSFLPFCGQHVEDISEREEEEVEDEEEDEEDEEEADDESHPVTESSRQGTHRINANSAPYPGRHQAPTSPIHRFTSTTTFTPDSKPDRAAIGGLLTSSYRQHQESLAAERERRRLEREERLQRIEREERNRFNRDYVEKREEARNAREERYKNLERLAAEDLERERPRVPTRGRTEITLCLSSSSVIRSVSRCPTSSSSISQENTVTTVHQTLGREHMSDQNVDLQTRAKLPAPELPVSECFPTPPSEPDKHQTETESQAKNEDVAEARSEQNVVTGPPCDKQPSTEKEERQEQERLKEQEQCMDHVAKQEQVEEVEVADVAEIKETNAEVDVELEEESEKEQTTERDVEDSVLLSEKERQNEEMNEKDNCSASSISSTSSTLEREEREEKLTNDREAGEWTPCITDADVNDECSKILNSKRFMLDMLYAQKTATKDEGNAGESGQENCKKETEVSDSSVACLASRISTLEAHRQAREENVKKIEMGHLDNQGSVRSVAERFGDLVKGLTSPPEMETSKEQQQTDKLLSAVSSASPPKKESDYIWDQLMAASRELRIREMDFTDLRDEDDVDILDMGSMMGSGDLIPPPPPPPCNAALPPPPPPFGCPPPPPMLGKMMPPPPPFMAPVPPPSPQLSRGEVPLFQKKKKTIRLFWNEVCPVDWQCKSHKFCKESLWSKLEPIKVDTSKLEQLFESKSKELPVTKKAAVDGKRQEIIVLDSKRSNAINIGLTVLPPPRTIKTAILNFDEYALNKEGIEKILTMIPTEEEKQRIQEAQLVNPDIPLGSAEQFLLILSSITELSARLQLWAFKMDYELIEKVRHIHIDSNPIQEVAEPLQDLKEGMDQLQKNKTLRYILSTLLAIGNFLNGSNAKGFELGYLEKVPEVKDTVHKQSLLHHACSIVVEKFPDSTDLYSEIGAITRLTKVDFDQLQDNLAQMERRCKASWDHLKVIAKHEMKPALKQRMSDFLKDCAERIIILKIVHRRIINRFHAFLLFLGHPIYAVREVSIHRFSKILSEFALEYRTTRERVLQQKQKRANHRERNKTRGKMITDSEDEDDNQSGKFSGATSEAQERQPQGIQYAEDAAEHENMKAVLKSSLQGGESGTSTIPGLRTRTRASNTRGRIPPWYSANDDQVNCTDDTADEIMERIVRSATQGPSQRTQPRERRRSRANRKSLRRTLKNGLTTEDANALGLSSGSEMQV